MDRHLAWLIWPLIVVVPLSLTFNDNYKKVFPADWYDETPVDYWNHPTGKMPLPLGLTLGIIAVVVGQAFTIGYFCLRRFGYLGASTAVQKDGVPVYELLEGIKTHLFQPEGFVMLGGYLIFTWMFRLMPKSYYSHSGGINWFHVALQLLIQDCVQYVMHVLEHRVSPAFYKISHKPHHKFTNPRMFDAFNGSIFDTFFMIIVPLVVTARLVDANVWSYMTFGTLLANWLVLIHMETIHEWDSLFQWLGFGTSSDHHVHHKMFIYNFGHLFMYWDMICSTYKSPVHLKQFNVFVPDPVKEGDANKGN